MGTSQGVCRVWRSRRHQGGLSSIPSNSLETKYAARIGGKSGMRDCDGNAAIKMCHRNQKCVKLTAPLPRPSLLGYCWAEV